MTTDLWDSRVGDSYISGTIHFVDKGFRLHRYYLNLMLLLQLLLFLGSPETKSYI